MRFASLSSWLLGPTLFITSSICWEAGLEEYLPRSLDETIQEFGLEKHLTTVPKIDSTEQSVAQRCEIACNIFYHLLSRETQLPRSPAYKENKLSYWAQQQSSISPACFVAVTRPESVSLSIAIARAAQCPFITRSGGHSSGPGVSNIEDGITIDLSLLNNVTVSEDKKVTAVGPGALWGEVYTKLDTMNLTVIGGRASSVGVGGLTLGGGMSFFSSKEGFACDNVKNYQVVMADGQILDVNQNSYPDLYFALRGGSNNFGVVTRFDLDTYAQGLMWGGSRAYPVDAREALAHGVVSLSENAGDDPNMAVMPSLVSFNGTFMSSLLVDYALPEPNPEIYTTNFAKLESFTAVRDTARIAKLSEFVEEAGESTPAGFRDRYTTATYKSNEELLVRVMDKFMAVVDRVAKSISNPDGFMPVMAFQPLPRSMIENFSKRGGNALGITPCEGPLMIVQFNWQWADRADDELILSAADNILTESNKVAAEMGLTNDYLYLNYAGPDQRPFKGYGESNLRKLREVQERYDPNKVFEVLQPGGFKLDM